MIVRPHEPESNSIDLARLTRSAETSTHAKPRGKSAIPIQPTVVQSEVPINPRRDHGSAHPVLTDVGLPDSGFAIFS